MCLVNRQHLHFPTFSSRTHLLLHCLILSVSVWNFLCASSLSLWEQERARLLAKALTRQPHLAGSTDHLGSYTINRVGNRTAPCGRPWVKVLARLISVPTLSFTCLFSSHAPIHPTTRCWIPISIILCRSADLRTVSKA